MRVINTQTLQISCLILHSYHRNEVNRFKFLLAVLATRTLRPLGRRICYLALTWAYAHKYTHTQRERERTRARTARMKFVKASHCCCAYCYCCCRCYCWGWQRLLAEPSICPMH